MTDTLLALVADWGLAAVFLSTFLSCVALPVPASLAMLAGGAFAASGDLPLAGVMAGAWAGAVAGDQTGYLFGRSALRLRAGGGTRHLARAARALQGRAFATVFLTRWLFSPLGPWVNLAAGSARLPWRGFAVASMTGEAVWVAIYTGLGWGFGAQVEWLAGVLANLSGGLAAAAVAVVAGVALLRGGMRRRRI
jgi:membrane protein DedA with SNARE-associated domain